jgi:D-glycero-alpha-D-manno-heptose-7-phosphate kinase
MLYSKEELKIFLVGRRENVAAAMAKMEINRNRTIIVSEDNMVFGVITDGDIRKMILDGRSTSTPCELIMNRNFKYASSEEGAIIILNEYPEIHLVPVFQPSKKFILSSICARF